MNNKNEVQEIDLEINLEQAEIIKDDALKMVCGGGYSYLDGTHDDGTRETCRAPV